MVRRVGETPPEKLEGNQFPESRKARQIPSEGPKLPDFLARYLNFFWKNLSKGKR